MSAQAFFALVPVLSIGLSTAESLAAANSWVKVNGNTYALNYAYAVPNPHALPSEKANGTFDTYLLALDTEIPDKFFADPFWYSHIQQDPKVHGLLFVVDAKKQLIGGGLLPEGKDSLNGIWTRADFAITASDAQHWEGSGKIGERRLPDGTMLAFEVTLNAPVWKAPTVKPPTPEDATRAAASPQAKVYSAFLSALKAGNGDAFKAQLSAEARATIATSPEVLAANMDAMKQMAPKNPRLLRLTVDGNTADLEVADGADSSTVQFVLEGGQWKIRGIDSN